MLQEMGEVSMPLEGLAMCVGFSALLLIAMAIVGYISNSALRVANASSKQIRAVYREAESVRHSQDHQSSSDSAHSDAPSLLCSFERFISPLFDVVTLRHCCP